MGRVVGSCGRRGFGSPIRWATPVVCTEHGPLKCTLTFIRISLTPIMGESARLQEQNCDLQRSRSPHGALRRLVPLSFLSARPSETEDKQAAFQPLARIVCPDVPRRIRASVVPHHASSILTAPPFYFFPWSPRTSVE